MRGSLPCLLFTLAAAALAAVPGAAARGSVPPVSILTFSTASLRASLGGKPYALRLEATKTSDKLNATLTLTFVRVSGSSTQTHAYEFTLPGRALSCGAGYSTCRLSSGRSLGRYGRIDLAFSARTAATGTKPDDGCTGTARRRAGAVRGELAFADRTVALRVAAKYGKRALHSTAVTFRGHCGTAPAVCHTKLFGLSGGDAAVQFAVLAPPAGAAEARFAVVSPAAATKPATVMRAVDVRNLSSDSVTIAPDLSSASFDAAGLPFLSGSVTYTATRSVPPYSSSCGQITASLGRAAGDIAAVFDGVGRRPLAATGGYLESLP
jgi:hypothetical protein